jgi:hypothetical protein
LTCCIGLILCFIFLRRYKWRKLGYLRNLRWLSNVRELQKLEEANAQLRAELATAHTNVAEVERRERSLTSDYDGLCRDFGDLQTSHVAVVKEKANLEKTERE